MNLKLIDKVSCEQKNAFMDNRKEPNCYKDFRFIRTFVKRFKEFIQKNVQ